MKRVCSSSCEEVVIEKNNGKKQKAKEKVLCGGETSLAVTNNMQSEHDISLPKCKSCDNETLKTHVVTEAGDTQKNFQIWCKFCNSNQQITNKNENFNINDFPTSILIQIFHNLTLQDVMKRVSLVCKLWHNLCCDPDLWRSISLKGQLKVDDALLLRLTSYCGNVTSLDLTDVKFTTNEGMSATLKQCRHLQRLSLVRNMHLTDYAFLGIGAYCHKLKHLKLDYCTALTDQSLFQIGLRCSKLEFLGLSQCHGITDEGLAHIAEGCPQMKHLYAEQCRNVSDVTLKEFSKMCSQMKSLHFMNNNFTDIGIRCISKFRHLEELEGTQLYAITDENLTQIVVNCPKLITLNVSLCTNITDVSVENIAKHSKNIRNLFLVSCRITDRALVSLSKCQSLERLDVGWCIKITVAGAETISEGCRSLQYLGLMRCDSVNQAASQYLVENFPGITYSTFWIECEKLLASARDSGYHFEASELLPFK